MTAEIVAGLPLRRTAAGDAALCLVTGATGYIGGRLITELLDAGYRVRVLARNASRLTQHSWFASVEVIEGDAEDPPFVTVGVPATRRVLDATPVDALEKLEVM